MLFYVTFFFIYNIFFTEIKAVTGKKLYYFIYTLAEFLCFSLMIKISVAEKKFSFLYFILISLFTLFLIGFYSFGNIRNIDSIPIGIESIFLMILIVYYFYSELKNVSSQNIYDTYSFWIIIGILIYIGFTFFFNILANSLDRNFLGKYFSYSYLGDIIRNIFFGISVLFMAKKSSKEKSKTISNVPYLDMI